MKSGNLNFLEPSGPLQACNGTALPFYLYRHKNGCLKQMKQKYNKKLSTICPIYKGADKSLARPGRKQANDSVRMAWISFGALLCRKKKKHWWQLASRCCRNRARSWHASELVSFLIGLRTYQHPSTRLYRLQLSMFRKLKANERCAPLECYAECRNYHY